jgi:hypothetical protein
MKNITFLILFFLIGGLPLSGRIIEVPGDQPTIQAGIDAAAEEDTVVVDPGTYYENIFFRGKNVVLTSRFYETGDMNFIKTTIINGSQPADADTASCILIIDGEDSTAIVQGFTITGGTGTVWKDEHSPGTYREGGGIFTAFSSPVIQNNIIINNEAVNKAGLASAGGGAIRCGDGNPKILNNIIKDNKGRYGGGIVLNWCNAVVKNNIIAGNDGGEDYGGGGIWLNKSKGGLRILENNTIVYNHSNSDGGGILLYNSTSAIIRNNIIFNNTATSSQQISVRSGASATVSYSIIEGGWDGNGNMDAEPIIDSLNFMPNIELSPCIDAGDPEIIYSDPENPGNPEYAEFPSLGTTRNDMGAYGGPGRNIQPEIVTVIKNSLRSFAPNGFRVYQNYPNPFNPSTKIRFDLSESGFTTLKVFNVLGLEIATLVNSFYSSGSYEIIFDASYLPSGIYFYKLNQKNYNETKKMILLR